MSEDNARTLESNPPLLQSIEDVLSRVPPGPDREVFNRLVRIAHDNNLHDLSDVAQVLLTIQREGKEKLDKYLFKSASLDDPMKIAAEIPSGDLQEVTREVAALTIVEYVGLWHGPFRTDLGTVIHLPGQLQQGAVLAENLWLTFRVSDEKKGDDKKETRAKSAAHFLEICDELDLRTHLSEEDYTALYEVRQLERKLLRDLLEVALLRRTRSEHQHKKLKMLDLKDRWISLSHSLPWERILSVIPKGIKDKMEKTNQVLADTRRNIPDLFRP